MSNDDMPEPKVAAGTSSGELQQPSPVAEDKGHSANGFADVPLAGLLSRYVSVWLWSIILGSTVTGLLTVPRYSEFGNYGSASTLLLVIAAISYLSYISCLSLLLVYLRNFIVPYVLSGIEDPASRRNSHYHTLPYAFSFLTIGFLSQGFNAFAAAILNYSLR